MSCVCLREAAVRWRPGAQPIVLRRGEKGAWWCRGGWRGREGPEGPEGPEGKLSLGPRVPGDLGRVVGVLAGRTVRRRLRAGPVGRGRGTGQRDGSPV